MESRMQMLAGYIFVSVYNVSSTGNRRRKLLNFAPFGIVLLLQFCPELV
jgi:hypothetical protein